MRCDSGVPPHRVPLPPHLIPPLQVWPSLVPAAPQQSPLGTLHQMIFLEPQVHVIGDDELFCKEWLQLIVRTKWRREHELTCLPHHCFPLQFPADAHAVDATFCLLSLPQWWQPAGLGPGHCVPAQTQAHPLSHSSQGHSQVLGKENMNILQHMILWMHAQLSKTTHLLPETYLLTFTFSMEKPPECRRKHKWMKFRAWNKFRCYVSRGEQTFIIFDRHSTSCGLDGNLSLWKSHLVFSSSSPWKSAVKNSTLGH